MIENILIVEDDKSVAEGLRDILAGNGYGVSTASNIRDSLTALQREPVSLILLDVSLGPDSGFDLCKAVREKSDVPILFLTACSSEMELVRGFQMGGDDYVTKPFRMQELLMRIRALLRRAKGRSDSLFQSGELLFDRERMSVAKGGTVLDLTATERKLAFVLIQRWPAAVSREELLYQVWDRDADFVEANTLSVNVSRLREKLGDLDGSPYIETVRGVGYRWAAAVGK